MVYKLLTDLGGSAGVEITSRAHAHHANSQRQIERKWEKRGRRKQDAAVESVGVVLLMRECCFTLPIARQFPNESQEDIRA